MKTSDYPLLPVPAEVREAIGYTILGYLRVYEQARLVPLQVGRMFSMHDGCIGRSIGVLAGTPVWAFRHQKWSYSAYRKVFDEDYPAVGADVLDHGSDWTFVVLIDGKVCDLYVEGARHVPPRRIGKVGEIRQDF